MSRTDIQPPPPPHFALMAHAAGTGTVSNIYVTPEGISLELTAKTDSPGKVEATIGFTHRLFEMKAGPLSWPHPLIGKFEAQLSRYKTAIEAVDPVTP